MAHIRRNNGDVQLDATGTFGTFEELTGSLVDGSLLYRTAVVAGTGQVMPTPCAIASPAPLNQAPMPPHRTAAALPTKCMQTIQTHTASTSTSRSDRNSHGTSGRVSQLEREGYQMSGRSPGRAGTAKVKPIVIVGASYAAGWNLGPLNGVPVISRAEPGQQSFEMLERFDRDVVNVGPRAVVVWGFLNDIHRATDISAALARVRDCYQQMIARARAHDIEPVLSTELTIRAPHSWTETLASWVGRLRGKQSYQQYINQHVLDTNRWLRDLAAREKLLLLDLHAATSAPGGPRRREFTKRDGSHLTPAGYLEVTRYAAPLLTRHVVEPGLAMPVVPAAGPAPHVAPLPSPGLRARRAAVAFPAALLACPTLEWSLVAANSILAVA